MNIIINHNKLLSALRTVERVVSKSTALPILQSLLIKTDNGRLKISATNLEIGMNYWISARIITEGEIAVPARIFSDFINNIQSEKIALAVTKNIIAINSEAYKTQILGVEPAEFPIIPTTHQKPEQSINKSALRQALMSVIDATSLSEIRPELNGVCVNITAGKAEFAATDSFRLSEKIIDLQQTPDASFIIPRTTALEIIRIVDNLEEDVDITVQDNQLFIFNNHFQMVSRLIDGRYPEYKRFIPDKFIARATVNKSDFEKNIRLASIFSSQISDIKLRAIDNRIEIIAQSSDRGDILAQLPCELENEGFEIPLNYHYLLDGLKILPSDNIILHFTGDGSPLVIKGQNISNQTYLIMPLRN